MIRLRYVWPWFTAVLLIILVRQAIWHTLPASHHDMATQQVSSRQLVRTSDVRRDWMVRREATAIPTDNWMEFQISRQAKRLRVLSNAIVPRQAANAEFESQRTLSESRSGWRYAIDYEWIDFHGDIIKKSTYHFRSATQQWVDPESGEMVFAIAMDVPQLVSTQTKSIQWSMNSTSSNPPAQPASSQPASSQPVLSQPVILRLRLANVDDGIQRVYTRVLEQVERPDYDETKTWLRTSKSERARLCSHCVFEADLLSIEDRQDLLRMRWIPALKLDHFESDTLHFLDRNSFASVSNNTGDPAPSMLDGYGIESSLQDHAVIEIPEGPGWISVTTSPANRLDPEHPPASQLTYQTANADVPLSFSKTVSQDQSERFAVEGGLLVIDTPTACLSRVLWQSRHDSLDLPPVALQRSANRSQYFLVDQQPLLFDVHGSDQNKTPLRLVVRSTQHPAFASAEPKKRNRRSSSIRCEWFDADGNVLSDFDIPSSQIDSKFDQVNALGEAGLVSEPTTRFIAYPNAAKQLRLSSSNEPLLVSVHSRPLGLPDVQRVGQPAVADQPTQAKDTANTPTWFPLRPQAYDALISRNRAFWVSQQKRPIDRDPQIMAGDFQWHRFVPSGNSLSREGMIELEDYDESWLQGRGALGIHHQLTEGTSYRFDRYADQHVLASADARVTFAGDQAPGTVSVMVNNDVFYQQRMASRCGEFSLPELPPTGTIRIDTEFSSRVFLRGRVITSTERYRLRILNPINSKQPLEFEYEKLSGDDELVTVRFYRTESKRVGERLSVRLLDAPPKSGMSDTLAGWTVRQHGFEIGELPVSTSIVIDNSATLTQAAECFIPLRSDLPPGLYRIQVQCDSAGYVLMSQAIAGQAPQRFVHTEAH